MRLDGASSVTKGPLMMLSTGRIEEKKGGKEERSRVRNIFRREQVPPKPSSFDTLLHLSPVATVAQVLPVAEKFALSPPRVVADNERVLQFCRFHLYLRHLLYRESLSSFSFSSFLFFTESASIVQVVKTSLLFSKRAYSKARTIVSFEFFFSQKIAERYRNMDKYADETSMENVVEIFRKTCRGRPKKFSASFVRYKIRHIFSR